MNLFRQLLILMIGLGVSGILSACQEGHTYGSRYHNGFPVDKKTKKPPVPDLGNKPKPPAKVIRKTASGKIIRVRKGDGIYALSRRYGVTVRAIIQTNHLKPPYLLHPGQRLKSPATAIHTVVKSDTVYSLSRKCRVDMTTFTRLNGLKRPYILTIGQKLKVGSAGKPAHRVRRPPPPPRSGKGFMWPVKGPILSSFGPKDKGYHNDGINIAAKTGSYVRASQSGVVVHSGRKIRGFGRLILIRHPNGWLTAYAHNSVVLVHKGQSVKRGQAIARVGQSGGVKRPQLHFEMRKGARAINPVKYLKS